MLTTIMKYVAIATLLASLLWKFVPNARTYLDFIVAAGAIFVLVQAVNLRRYLWVVGFAAITFMFNPIRPIEISVPTTLALEMLTLALFAVSLQTLKTSPRLTIPSITATSSSTEAL